MKTWVRLLAVAGLLLMLTACGTQEVIIVATKTPPPTVTPPQPPTPAPTIAPPTATPLPPAPTVPPPATPAPTVVFTNVQGAALFGMASVTIKGPPNTNCVITYTTPAGSPSQAQGLEPKVTGADGVATWAWTIGTLTRPGTGMVAVMCGGARGSTPITIRP